MTNYDIPAVNTPWACLDHDGQVSENPLANRVVYDDDFNVVTKCDEAINAQRIVACVNACAQIEDPADTIEKAREVIAGLLKSINIAIERSERDIFGVHHNDATDNISAAERLLDAIGKTTK